MLHFLGLDLATSPWNLSRFRWNGEDSRKAFEAASVSTAQVAVPGASASEFFTESESLLRLRGPTVDYDTLRDNERRLEARIVKLNATIARSIRGGDVIGVCHPYGTSPIVRQFLRTLVLGPRARPGADSSQLAVAAIDAPLAGCIQQICTQRIHLPATFVVLCGISDEIEVTGVRATADGSQLQLDIFASTVIQPGHGDRESAALKTQFTHTAEHGECRLLAPDKRLHKPAAALGRALHLPPTCVLTDDPSIFSCGAALFAASRNSEVLPATAFTAVRTQHIVPRPIGILGTNPRTKEWFWRRLFQPGDQVGGPTARIVVEHTESLPEHVMFAEHVGASAGVPMWLCEDDWLKGRMLRFFLSTRLSRISEGLKREALEFKIENPSGSADWSDQKIHAS